MVAAKNSNDFVEQDYSSATADSIVEVQNVTRRFGSKVPRSTMLPFASRKVA